MLMFRPGKSMTIAMVVGELDRDPAIRLFALDEAPRGRPHGVTENRDPGGDKLYNWLPQRTSPPRTVRWVS